jgi:alcohol dehydrogenase (cytochrome c)
VTYIRSISRRDTAPPVGNASAGESLFWGKAACGKCHMVASRGGRLGPDLTRAGRTRSAGYLRESVVAPDADVTPGYATISVTTRDGRNITGVQKAYDNFSAQLMDVSERFHSFLRSDTQSMTREQRSLMPSYAKTLTATEIDDVVAYLASLRGEAVGEPAKTAQARITPDHLLKAQAESSSWLMYGRNYAGWRYSELKQIHAGNVAQLKPQWIFQTAAGGKIETTPLVFDKLMYVTGPSNNAWALDAVTGRRLWHYAKRPPEGLNLCCGEVNRGFAALGDRLFKVNIEATLAALDAKTGRLLWETTIDDYKKGFSATVAPLAVKNMVLIGIAGAEFGVRAFIDAYDADTGKRLWRFHTVPAPGEPGGQTWGGDSWKRGGGSTWITGTYDPELNLVYWGTGNPGPDMNGDVRPGDNLYTCSVVALDADTGKLKWHFQFTPHDVHDWDAISDPVLVDIKHNGQPVKAVVQANRNGFFYALDRVTGKFLFAKPYTKVTWADGIGADGRPNLVKGQDPTEEGNLSCPGLGGGHNWQATAFSPQTALYYFNSTDGCHIYYKTDQEFIEGQWYQASTVGGAPKEPNVGSVLAVDPSTGTIKWRFPLVTPPSSGMLATGGGLVFTGDSEGYVIALDGRTGKPLWKFYAGGTVIAPPMTYSVDGKQYITVAAGSSLMTFGL